MNVVVCYLMDKNRFPFQLMIDRLVTMLHFGYDSPLESAGSEFCTTWKDGQSTLARAYSKVTSSGIILRNEIQQYPKKSLGDIVMRKAQQ